MNKQELIRKISEDTNLTQKQASAALDSMLDAIMDAVKNHEKVQLVGFGTFEAKQRNATGTCREYYQNGIKSFILVSSDSDYWGLIAAMPELRFFVMVENEKCGPAIKNALINAGITYCYIDDFCTGNSDEIKIAAVLSEVRRVLDNSFHINVQDILQEAYTATRADLTTAEKRQFYDRYIRPMKIVIAPDGEATIELGS